MPTRLSYFAFTCVVWSVLAAGQATTVPSSSHVFVIVEENQSYTTVTDTTNASNFMPWLVGEGTTYGHATNYSTDSNGSLLDYLWLSSGSCHGDSSITPVDCVLPPGTHSFGCTGGSCVNPITDDNIFREMIASGISWKEYMESIPHAGYMDVSVFPYDTHHNPAMWYSDIISSTAQQQNIVPFTQFQADLANNQLPRYSIIIPDDTHDAHDDTPAVADTWLKNNISPLLQQSFFQPCGDGLLIITFDNGDGDGAGPVFTAVIGPKVRLGFASNVAYKHENALRTILDALGITTRPGAAATVSGMTDFFIMPAPCPVLAPSPLSFSSEVLQVPTSSTVTINNGGDASMTINSIAASGDFSQSNSCGSSVGARSSCTVTVTFKPTATGLRSGTLTVKDSASGSPHVINLSGTGVLLGLSSASLSFGNQVVNTSSASQSVTVTNTGSTDLAITGISASAGYSETDNCGTLAANGTCTVNITFGPSATGLNNGTVMVSYAGTHSNISASGTGVALGLSATSISFGAQLVNTASAAQSVTVTNTGSTGITITGVATSEAYSETDNCGALASNGTCTVNIKFAPLSTGTIAGSVTLHYNGTQSTITLSGTGTDFSVAPQSGAPSSTTITAGQTGTFNLAVNGSAAFTGTVNLTCSGAPLQSTCSLSAPSLTLNGTTPVNFTANVSTTRRSSLLPATRFRQIPPTLIVFFLAAIIALWAMRTHSRVRIRYAGALAFLALSLAAVIGCGGGGGGGGSTGTPAGSYTIVVTASSGSVNRTFNLTLNVN